MKIRLLLLIFLLVGIFYACRKNSASRQESQVTSPATFTIALAKSYLDSSLHSTSNSLKLASIDSSRNANPTGFVYWKKARELKAQQFGVVEIPLITTNMLITLHDIPADSVKVKPDITVARATFARLIIYKDNTTKKINKEILIYQPDKSYLQRHSQDASGNWLDKMAPDFSGYIEYRRYDGTRKYILRMVNGKSIARYNITGVPVNQSSQQIESVRTDDYSCYQDCEPAYNENCWQDDEGQEQCVTVYSGYDECETYCIDIGGDPSPDPDPQPTDPGDGGGGGSGGSGDTGAPTDPCNTVKSNAAQNANTMINGNTSIASAFNAARQNSINGNESGFHIDNTSGIYTASTPIQTSDEDAAYSTANYDANTVAIGHDHDASSFPQPSPYDAYSIGELAVTTNGKITMDYTLSASANYVLVVTNMTLFNTFLTNYPETNLAKDANGKYTGDLDQQQALGANIYQITLAAISAYILNNAVDPNNPTDAELDAARSAGNEVGLVVLLDQYNTGITLLKADASGNFTPLHFTSTPLSNGQNLYSSSPCN